MLWPNVNYLVRVILTFSFNVLINKLVINFELFLVNQ